MSVVVPRASRVWSAYYACFSQRDVVVLLHWVVLFGWCLLVLERVKIFFSINESKRKAFAFSRKKIEAGLTTLYFTYNRQLKR